MGRTHTASVWKGLVRKSRHQRTGSAERQIPRTMLEGLRRYRVDELVYEGYEARGTVSIPLVDGTVRTLAAVSRVERVSLPEGIGFRPGEEKGELRVSMVGEGVITELEGWMNTRTARIELRDVYIPDTDTLLNASADAGMDE